MRYLVIYFFVKGNGNGIGSVDTDLFKHNPPTLDEIRSLEKRIVQQFDNDSVCVINWLPISETTED